MTCGVDTESLAPSGVSEPRPDVEEVLAEPVCCRSSVSSACCFSTKSSRRIFLFPFFVALFLKNQLEGLYRML